MQIYEKIKLICALIGILAVIYMLVKKYETRLILISVGLVLCFISLEPMAGFDAFVKRMTSSGLITAICSSMGFAYVMKYTRCDEHLVLLLTKPLRNAGIFLIPLTVLLTFFINIAISSAAGCSAAVGATLIPILMLSGITPAMAAAAVLAGTFGSMLSPATPHNAFTAEISNKIGQSVNLDAMGAIAMHTPYVLICGVIVMIVLTITAIVFKDYKKGEKFEILKDEKTSDMQKIEKSNIFYALMPVFPLVLLIISEIFLPEKSKVGVAQAMLIGAVLAMFITRINPQKMTNEFFNGMGMAYAEIMGIIIAASVFVSGLEASGAIAYAIDALKHSKEFVSWGGTFGPFIMSVITGSADASTMAFNEAITPHAKELGYNAVILGMGAADAAAIGRSTSPIAGACIVCAGIAGVSPTQIAKRTAPAMILATIYLAIFML